IANPGGNESLPAYPNKKAIAKAIGVVVASYFSEKSLKQRHISGEGDKVFSEKPFMPVLLQKMVGEKADQVVYSGVMYSGQAEGVRIQIAPGHGELIVNSKAPFDTFYVSNHNLVRAKIGKKTIRLVSKRGVLVEKNNSLKLRDNPSVSNEVALGIAEVGRLIEQHYGRPMDVEFVYQAGVLNLVQARPIPIGDSKKINPSTISPSKIQELITKKAVFLPAEVISEGAFASKVITKPEEELIISDNIGAALEEYLKQKDSKLKAVIVRAPAPSTSHEAAQFNAKAIPVLYIPDTTKIPSGGTGTQCLVVDPQGGRVVDLSALEASERTEKFLQQNFIQEGMFTFPLKSLTLSSLDFKSIPLELRENVKILLDKVCVVPATSKTKQQTVTDSTKKAIEKLKIAKRGDNNPDAYKSLCSFISKAKHTQNRDLLLHTVVTAAEIYNGLEAFKKSQAKPTQREFLSSVSLLESLFSLETREWATSKKEDAAIKTMIKDKDLDVESKDYFKSFYLANKIALTDPVAKRWTSFALEICKDPKRRRELANELKYFIDLGMGSDFINKIFAEADEKMTATQLMDSFTTMIIPLKKRLDELELSKHRATIESHKNLISEWSNPDKFEKRFSLFSKEIGNLISKLNLNEKDNPLVKKAVLRAVQEMTEVIDQTIKSLKGNANYDKNLQVKRFSKLLEIYHQLMHKWVEKIPPVMFEKWSKFVDDISEYNTQEGMLKNISDTFNALKNKDDPKQLNSSNGFSVASARVGTSASFRRQFMDKKDEITLEDLFSLMHQNILFSTATLIRDSQIAEKNLPNKLKGLMDSLSKMEFSVGRSLEKGKAELMNLQHVYPSPIINLEYNLPLRNHSAKLFIDYDTHKESFKIKMDLYGENWRSRMNTITYIANREAKYLKSLNKEKFSYNSRSKSLSIDWHFDKAINPEYLSEVVADYASMTTLMPSEDAAHTQLIKRITSKVIKAIKEGADEVAELSNLLASFSVLELMKAAGENGHIKLVELLVAAAEKDKRIDLAVNDNEVFMVAAQKGHSEVVKLLLAAAEKDKRIDPAADNNVAIRLAAENGHTEVVKLLLAAAERDERIDPAANNNYALRNAAENGHTEVVKLLLAAAERDERINPAANNNYALRNAAESGHTEVVKLLLAAAERDERINPTANNNYALIMSAKRGHSEVAKLLLVHPKISREVVLQLTKEKENVRLEKFLTSLVTDFNKSTLSTADLSKFDVTTIKAVAKIGLGDKAAFSKLYDFYLSIIKNKKTDFYPLLEEMLALSPELSRMVIERYSSDKKNISFNGDNSLEINQTDVNYITLSHSNLFKLVSSLIAPTTAVTSTSSSLVEECALKKTSGQNLSPILIPIAGLETAVKKCEGPKK
ncbi:MAG: ankyrin repeat domain-containing protein, partial [Oligoflexia bacterium]|nr:ankyrin repeat domain-containing protein [Oligoflexia bacterium]